VGIRPLFTQVDDPALTQIAVTWSSPEAVGLLRQVGERWLYTCCVCLALPLVEQERTGFRYDYSIYQVEYSRNLLFKRGQQMEQIFEALIDRTRTRLDIPRLKTIFGAKRRPFRHQGNPAPRLEIVTARPAYNLTVFKIHFGKLTLKLYSKGANVLRSEVTIHNTQALKMKRSLTNFPQIINHLKTILYRFLDDLHYIDHCFIAADTYDTLADAAYLGDTRVAGINLHQPRMRAVLEALVALALTPKGFTVADLATKVRAILALAPDAYSARHAAYDLKKFRAQTWVQKIGKSRRYQVPAAGLQIMAALLVVREKVLKPVLAGAGKLKRGPKPKSQTPIDALYQTLHMTMRELFKLLGIAV